MNRAAENGAVDRNSISGLPLTTILGEKLTPPPPEDPSRPRVQSNRTLLDIIQGDQDPLGGDDGQSWRQLTERLRLSCNSSSGSAWNSIAVDSNNARNGMIPRRLSSCPSNSMEQNISASSLLTTRRSQREADNINLNLNLNSNGGDGGAAAAELEQQKVSRRVSLMTLLAETDGSIYILKEEEKGIDLEEVGDCKCCVCMVRRKGAAFIPCGHTFCRVCSRQLLVERRNCPLCNALIHEILDIF